MTTNKSKSLTEDVFIEGLKTTIIFLETELSVLENKKADLYKFMNDFRIRHNHELGMIIGEILKLRLEEFSRLHDKNPDVKDDLDEAKEDYDQFKHAYKQIKEEMSKTLNKDQKKELQLKFHQASKLCHPDLVADDLKQQATTIFADLNNAYYRNDLKRVLEILEMLEKNEIGLVGKTRSISQKEQLELHETKLRTDIMKLRSEIDEICKSQSYLTVTDINDWDEYFAKTKAKLTLERDELKAKLESELSNE